MKTCCKRLESKSGGVYEGTLSGPAKKIISGVKAVNLDFQVMVLNENSARFSLNDLVFELIIDQWSPLLEITFNYGFMATMKAVTQVIFTQLQPYPALYFLPLQQHPLQSPWHYGTPKRMVKDFWENRGPFLNLGWPQDTIALEEEIINDEQFLYLCNQVFLQRQQIFRSLIESYEEGILACVFDSLDRVQHMFWKNRPDIIEAWYLKMDKLAGRITNQLYAKQGGESVRLVFLSDHGFKDYDYMVNVNRWLIEEGFLHVKDGVRSRNLSGVNWEKTQAYAVGLNSLYLNLVCREGRGSVTPAKKRKTLEDIRLSLYQWVGPDGGKVVQGVLFNEEAFEGPLGKCGPDLVIGYVPRYRASPETGLGSWGEQPIENNHNHWGANHCMDAKAVPGVIFSNDGLKDYPDPSYKDIPNMTIGKELDINHSEKPILSSEDQEEINERLKGLGYF
jgi:hypothetical protein